MDLITIMMQPDPKRRYTLADLVGHPWMKGEHASHAEVKVEFTTRH